MIANFASLFIIFEKKIFRGKNRKKELPFLASYINNLRSCLFCEAVFAGTAIMQGEGDNGVWIAELFDISPNAKVFNL